MLQKGVVSSLGEHIETACLFQVPVYECIQSQDGKTYHWEVHHPRAPADQFCHPPIVDNNALYSPVNLNHFELAYTRNCSYHQLFLSNVQVVVT